MQFDRNENLLLNLAQVCDINIMRGPTKFDGFEVVGGRPTEAEVQHLKELFGDASGNGSGSGSGSSSSLRGSSNAVTPPPGGRYLFTYFDTDINADIYIYMYIWR